MLLLGADRGPLCEALSLKRKRIAKAAILSLTRDTETVFCAGFKILAPKRSGGEVLYQRKPFRDFRVLPRGGRKED
jgi:hypothetical protein